MFRACGGQLDFSVPATEFAYFPKLPLELRRKIWQAALPSGPRLLRIEGLRHDIDIPLPSQIAIVSQEARTETIRQYPELWRFQALVQGKPSSRCIRLDPKVDLPCLAFPQLGGQSSDLHISCSMVTSIEHLVIDAADVWQRWKFGTELLHDFDFLSHYNNLKKISLLVKSLCTPSETNTSIVSTSFELLPALSIPIAQWPAKLPRDVLFDEVQLLDLSCMVAIFRSGWKGRRLENYPRRGVHGFHANLRGLSRKFNEMVNQMALDKPDWKVPIVELAWVRGEKWK